ncbi:hypothetical protein D1AOALGA4SA_8884 [Olavius algarvensis Delta 1 endosymbiont]|nr:hypothetical protein D1AOALGA4SA_8884 [Olavius algarvensis Delta 1 endosymbiont]
MSFSGFFLLKRHPYLICHIIWDWEIMILDFGIRILDLRYPIDLIIID